MRKLLVIFLGMFFLTGVFYPLLVTLIGQAAFPYQANGSLIMKEQKIVGASTIGQSFSKPYYFHGRPSVNQYDGKTSGGSNLALSNPLFLATLKKRIEQLKEENAGRIPMDMVTASASGLDPHISLDAAVFQMKRVAHARGVPLQAIENILNAHREARLFGILGEPKVNVLLLNLELDRQLGKAHER